MVFVPPLGGGMEINMARKAREKSSTGIYAVVLRGNEEIFKTEAMREAFSEAAKKYLGRGLIGVVYADDHADMLVRESEKGISMDMKPLMTSFARTYNRENGSDGKVYRDRFKSVPVETRTLLRACRAYMKGGEIAAPYITNATAAPSTKKTVSKPAPKKTAAKPGAKKKTAEKPVKKADKKPTVEIMAEEKTPEPAPKPKKKSNLPSWLL